MIPFAPPHIDQLTIDAVVDTLKSGWITTGPKTKKFEKSITAYCGNKATLCLNSATAGLEIMLRWFGVREGDEVILPGYTYAATANVIIHCGAKPVFADVGPDFNIAVSQLKKLITPRTKVIMPVDIGGFPCDYQEINALVNDPSVKALFHAGGDVQSQLGRILVLSDAAHSIGANYNGKKTGALTDVSVFSFHAVKNLSSAEGGAIAFNLPEPFDNTKVYEELCIKTLHGQNKDALAKSKPGNWKYDIVEAGFKMNMTDIMASMGQVELDRYDNVILSRRKKIFEMYTEALKGKSWAIIPEYRTEDKETSYHLFMLRIRNAGEQQRDAIIARIFASGVSVNVHFLPVQMTGFYKSLGYRIEDFPGTYSQFENEISLPVYVNLTDGQCKTVTDAVISAVEEVMQ